MNAKAVKTDILGAVTIGDVEFTTEDVLQCADVSKDELRKMIADEISEQVLSEFGKGQRSARASFVNRVADVRRMLDGVKDVMNRIDSEVQIVKSDQLQRIIRAANEASERLEAVKRKPNGEATSVSPARWQCNVCGTICGRMNLFGTMSDNNWTLFPRYCPGCGAENVNFIRRSENEL